MGTNIIEDTDKNKQHSLLEHNNIFEDFDNDINKGKRLKKPNKGVMYIFNILLFYLLFFFCIWT